MFALSTHANWIFSSERLREIKQRTNQQGLSGDMSVLGRLTCEEEDGLKSFFLAKIEDICARLQCSYKVTTTAIIYFVRFFLVNSVMDYNINRIMFTCVHLASKVEEERRTVDHIVRESDGLITDKEIINAEYTVLQGLKFHLEVLQPLNCLTGFVVDMQVYYCNEIISLANTSTITSRTT